MNRLSGNKIFQWITNYARRNRIRLSFIILTLLLAHEFLIDKIHPYGVKDIWGIGGAALVVLGVGVRSWAAGTIVKNRKLAITGPYSLMRHPLYFGSLLMALGFCSIIGNIINILVIILIGLTTYFAKLVSEENFLAEKFGAEWAEYVNRTAIFFPKTLPKNIFSRWSFSVWRRNKEYNAFLSGLIGVVVLLIHWHW